MQKDSMHANASAENILEHIDARFNCGIRQTSGRKQLKNKTSES